MAKINVPKSFDKGQIPEKLLAEIEPYIDYSNQNFTQVIQALSNGLTFTENIRCSIKTVSAKHLVPTSLNLGSSSVTGVLILNSAAPVRSFYYSQVESLFNMTFRFDEPVSVSSKSIVVSSGTCTVETNDAVMLGDIIRLSGYSGGGANNGDFLVSYVYSSTPKKVEFRNPNSLAVSEARDTYSPSTPASRSVVLAFLTN